MPRSGRRRPRRARGHRDQIGPPRRKRGSGVEHCLGVGGVRLYNPATGLFLTRDPIPGGNPTPYAYPLDPVNMYDLDGMWSWSKLKKAGKAVGSWAWKHKVDIALTAASSTPAGAAARGAYTAYKGYRAVQTLRVTRTAAKACSFAGATVVLMADGTRKAVEDVAVGDWVVATDPETGEQAAKRVEQVFVHSDTVVDLVVGTQIIVTTEDHPFWSVTDGHFERADALAAGELVLAANGDRVRAGSPASDTFRVVLSHNLRIEGIHTYHVGADKILVASFQASSTTTTTTTSFSSRSSMH